MAMAAAAAAAGKALRGGRSSSLLREIGQRVPQEGMLPKLAGSPPAKLSGARPIHTGLWGKSSSMKLSSMSRKVPEGPPHHSPEFIIRHLNERINTIESFATSSRRYLFAAWINLVVGGVMLSPLLMDYIRLQKIEEDVCKLRASVAEAKVRSRNLHTALHGK